MAQKRSGGKDTSAKWKDFQYLIAHAYPGEVHPDKFRICFADAARSQDVLTPLILEYRVCVSLVVRMVFGCGEVREPIERYGCDERKCGGQKGPEATQRGELLLRPRGL